MRPSLHALLLLGSVCAGASAVAEGTSKPAPPPSADRGRFLFESKACFACHRLDGHALVGPPLVNIFGGHVLLADGTVSPIDDGYVRESILNPSAAIVAGYEQPMINIDLDARDAADLVAFLHTMGQAPAEPAANLPLLARGKALFEMRGCTACHGLDGVSSAANPGAVARRVPQLAGLAERMMLDGPDDAKAVVALLEKGPIVDKQGALPFASYPRFAAQYRAVHTKIASGGKAASEAPNLLVPPLSMPAWKGQLTDRDIDAVIAYLITMQNWEE